MTSVSTGETTPPPEDVPPSKRLSGTYWLCNVIEMWERLAYYTLRPVAPIYIMQATEPGGLRLTAEHKGWIYAWWAIFQSFLPMVTGGYADRYGYKKTLFFSITLNIIGYLMMAFLHSYYGFFAGIIVLATGTAFFKPSLQATIAHNLDKFTSSLGWGIFYWVVNVGSLIGHYISPLLLGDPHSTEGWRLLFLACAGFTAMNYLMLFTIPDVPSGASKTQNPLQVLAHTIRYVVEPRLLTWLLIMSCFWMMMYQLWDLQPNFIEDWIDSSGVAAYMPIEAWSEYGDRGLVRVPQQVLISLNALLIVLFMVPVSWAVRKMRTLSSMFFGMLIATIGVLVAGLTGSGWILLLGIVCFSLGEMLTGPKKNEYLGLIAPPGKKGLYLGYVNIPIGVGVGIGSYIAGVVYDNYGEKATLALEHLGNNTQLLARAARSADWSDALHRIPELSDIDREDAFNLARERLPDDDPAETLRGYFRYDEGQIVNLGLLYLAQEADFRPDAARRIAETLQEEKEDLQAVDAAEKLASGEQSLVEIGLARYVHHLPDALDVKRAAVLEILREEVNESVPSEQRRDDSLIIAMLWDRFGNDSEVLNNLALEYLAQSTDLVARVVAGMEFEDPVEELPKRLGIGRTKSFAALSRARGADPEKAEQFLNRLDVPGDMRHARSFAYLASLPHQRFLAVARRNWSHDKSFLRELVLSDPDATAVAREKVRGDALIDELARNPEYIRAALAEKNWTDDPEQAARLLRLNPFEARALAAAEMNNAAVTTTQLLWKQYHPQYKVWIPFASIGVIAAIALYIFGRLAKRWSDMNA